MEQINHNIACSVENCAHHAGSRNYCTLREIKVGCCTPQVTSCECTECASYEKRGRAK